MCAQVSHQSREICLHRSHISHAHDCMSDQISVDRTSRVHKAEMCCLTINWIIALSACGLPAFLPKADTKGLAASLDSARGDILVGVVSAGMSTFCSSVTCFHLLSKLHCNLLLRSSSHRLLLILALYAAASEVSE